MTRQLRRARLRELAASADLSLSRGLPRKATAEQLLALVDLVGRRLTAARDALGVGEVASLAHRLFDASLKASPPGVALACKKGCNWCCYNAVSATVPEILLVATTASSRGLLTKDHVIAAAQAGRELGPGERLGRKVPCPMLAPAGCEVYAARPTMCRVANATDVAPCIEEYEGRNLEADVPVAVAHMSHGFNARAVLIAALRTQSLDDTAYDLAGGLLAARDFATAATRFLAREKVWDDLGHTLVDPAVSTLADELVRAHRQLLERE